jgi:hypothetical protein
MQHFLYTLSARVSPAGQNRRFTTDFTRASREKRQGKAINNLPTAFSNDVDNRDDLSNHVITNRDDTVEQTKQQSSSRCNVY